MKQTSFSPQKCTKFKVTKFEKKLVSYCVFLKFYFSPIIQKISLNKILLIKINSENKGLFYEAKLTKMLLLLSQKYLDSKEVTIYM